MTPRPTVPDSTDRAPALGHAAIPAAPDRWLDRVHGRLLRLAASGLFPARWVEPNLPPPAERTPRTGRLRIEIVSHCWNYAHLLAHQLSSLVAFPPTAGEVTMSVYHALEDAETVAMLESFGARTVPGLTWSWRAIPREMLFRRAIGRNHAALTTTADWVWFTDCDLMFREGCLDGLVAALQGRRDALVFPRTERCTPLLTDDHPLIEQGRGEPRVLDLDTSLFTERERTRATGPLQIAHGDVVRAVGYCARLAHYQRPSPTWCKAYEDRAFRWLLRTQGTPLDIPGVHRIRHVSKGRYTGGALSTGSRSLIRRTVSSAKERRP